MFLRGRFSVSRLCISSVTHLSGFVNIFWNRYKSAPIINRKKMKAYINTIAQMPSNGYGSRALRPRFFIKKKLGPGKYLLNSWKIGMIASKCA